ncbi:unnamed protein product, partial [Mesorhabditis belari]|uniref:Uncharacterized protein n=1 Tax=Mesorhabditis belari TaxID=2138241 RepID=A0AAF3J4Z7_9BILA
MYETMVAGADMRKRILNDSPEAPLTGEVQFPVLPVVNDENEVTDGRPTFALGDEPEVPVIDDGNERSNATGNQPTENEPDQSAANEPIDATCPTLPSTISPMMSLGVSFPSCASNTTCYNYLGIDECFPQLCEPLPAGVSTQMFANVFGLPCTLYGSTFVCYSSQGMNGCYQTQVTASTPISQISSNSPSTCPSLPSTVSPTMFVAFASPGSLACPAGSTCYSVVGINGCYSTGTSTTTKNCTDASPSCSIWANSHNSPRFYEVIEKTDAYYFLRNQVRMGRLKREVGLETDQPKVIESSSESSENEDIAPKGKPVLLREPRYELANLVLLSILVFIAIFTLIVSLRKNHSRSIHSTINHEYKLLHQSRQSANV